jgi:Lrp/AsnC family transcriptional regulator, regulator for asnA, asnC and gidA
MKISELDQKIIQIIGHDATVGNTELAERLNVSSNTIRSRLKRLQEGGSMRIVAALNPYDFGITMAAMLAFKVAPNKIKTAVEELKKYPQIRWSSTTSGRYDIIAVSRFRSAEGLSKFLTDVVANIEGVNNIETFTFLNMQKGIYVTLIGPKDEEFLRAEMNITKGNNRKIDLFDKKLVLLLAHNATLSNEQLANHLNVSSNTIRRRLKVLMDDGALRIIAALNPADFGITMGMVIALKVVPEMINSTVNTLAKHQEIRWVSTTTGQFNVLAMARFHSADHASDYLSGISAKANGLISIETFISLDVLKEGYTIALVEQYDIPFHSERHHRK